MTKNDLVELVHEQVGLSKKEVLEFVETVLATIQDGLASGHDVKVGGFGTFSVRSKAARMGRNPRTGEEILVPSQRAVTFRPSEQFKERVKGSGERAPTSAPSSCV